MKTRKIMKYIALAAMAAAPLLTGTAQDASAQNVVAASCPSGYTLKGSNCIRNTQKKTYAKTGTQWAFVTRDAFGVKSATELEGANYCASDGEPADAAEKFFKDKGLSATHVAIKDDRAGIEKYKKFDCDILVVGDRVANATAESLGDKGAHIVLNEKFTSGGDVESRTKDESKDQAPLPPATATKKQPKAKTKTTQQSKPKVRRKRCSAVRYGYTSGNTCKCSGGRVFNGSQCVKPRYR